MEIYNAIEDPFFYLFAFEAFALNLFIIFFFACIIDQIFARTYFFYIHIVYQVIIFFFYTICLTESIELAVPETCCA